PTRLVVGSLARLQPCPCVPPRHEYFRSDRRAKADSDEPFTLPPGILRRRPGSHRLSPLIDKPHVAPERRSLSPQVLQSLIVPLLDLLRPLLQLLAVADLLFHPLHACSQVFERLLLLGNLSFEKMLLGPGTSPGVRFLPLLPQVLNLVGLLLLLLLEVGVLRKQLPLQVVELLTLQQFQLHELVSVIVRLPHLLAENFSTFTAWRLAAVLPVDGLVLALLAFHLFSFCAPWGCWGCLLFSARPYCANRTG